MNKTDRLNEVINFYISSATRYLGDYECSVCGNHDSDIAYEPINPDNIKKKLKHISGAIPICEDCDKKIKNKKEEIKIRKLRIDKLNRIVDEDN